MEYFGQLFFGVLCVLLSKTVTTACYDIARYNDECLALPKLNVQFLTMHDYLLRNLNLFRLESTYEIRSDMENIIPRMKPYTNGMGETQFAGWSRMAQPVTGFSIVEMGRCVGVCGCVCDYKATFVKDRYYCKLFLLCPLGRSVYSMLLCQILSLYTLFVVVLKLV